MSKGMMTGYLEFSRHGINFHFRIGMQELDITPVPFLVAMAPWVPRGALSAVTLGTKLGGKV